VGHLSRLCIENLENYEPEHYLHILERLPVSLCIDVGHLWLVGRDPARFMQEHLARTRIVHLHGVAGQDHRSLTLHSRESVMEVVDVLLAAAYPGVLTLEVFGCEDFCSSRATVVEMVDGRKES
jgi:sugar phosphate isomerase/epimerase